MDRESYLDALLTLPRIYSPIISPDGKWVAWTTFGLSEAADVYAAPTDGSAPPIRLTDTRERTFAASWTPDGRDIIVQQDHDSNERFRLFSVTPGKPGEMRPLTEESPNYFVRGGQIHPDGRWLVYAANLDVETGKEIEQTHVFRQDLHTGRRTLLAQLAKPSWVQPVMNHQGTHVLYTRKDLHPAGHQIWTVDIEGEEDREILNFGAESKVFASWCPDGRRVILLAETGNYRRVGIYDRKTGDTRWLLDDPARNIENAFMPHGSDKAVIVEVKDARVRSSLLDVDTLQETPLPDLPGNLSLLAPTGRGDEWVATYYSSTQPAELVRLSLGDVRPERFTSLTHVWEQTKLRPTDLTPAEDFRWKSVDGLEIQGWLYRAKGTPKGTVVYVHGGPTAHSEDALNNQLQFFVGEGFNVLDPNYRGSTGFGLAFMEAIKEDGWGGREQDDISTGIEALIEAGIAERGKVGITGTSYGGYSCWCAITHCPPDIIAASAPVCGMTDLVVDYETTRPDLRPYSEEMIGGRPDQVPQRYYERSPINFVGNIKGRLLIVQGLQDPNVSPQNVHTVREALNKAGIAYDVLTFDDEGHGIYRPRNRRVLYPRLSDFFAEAFRRG